ncbi:AraC family transcriptional regulator [Kaistia sp. UC242_56]|uniref:AraC family transcriptional regulator n=1 Tax=Kaistia sp. UC242_56 TaxID=3374625 RepID=UPI0037A17DD6
MDANLASSIELDLLHAEDGPLLYAVADMRGTVVRSGQHQHARGQLFGSNAGLLSLMSETAGFVVPPDYAIWIPPGVPHGARSHGPFAGWTAYIAPSACAGLPDTVLVGALSPFLKQAVLKAANWPEKRELGPPQINLTRVILDEIAALTPMPLSLPLPRDPRARKIARAIADDPAAKMDLAGWGVWAGIAPRTLTRRFIDETGMSFSAWRQRACLIRALERIAAGNPITHVALDVGYDSLSAFIAMFRRELGVTPARYFATPRPETPAQRGANSGFSTL